MEQSKLVKLQLPEMHPKQAELLMKFYTDPKVNFIVGATGTKVGKTYGAAIVATKFALENEDSIVWWIAPAYAQAEIGLDYIIRFLPKEWRTYNGTDHVLNVLKPNGEYHSRIEFKTAEDPDKLRGFRVNLIIADEMGRIRDASYESFMTTRTQTRAKIIFLSTPFGHNKFWELYKKGDKSRIAEGEEDPFPEYFSLNLPTSCNPWILPEVIEEQRRSLDSETFRQEYLAEFLTDSSSVFGDFRSCEKGSLEPPKAGTKYVMGLDLAQSHDFTVITVMDIERRHVVYFERFNQVNWEYQYQRIIDVFLKYNKATCVMDATSQGSPIAETLMRMGVNVIPYKTYTNIAKRELIEALKISIDNKAISFPKIPELRRELEDYEMEKKDSGVITYHAPRGRNSWDDCVISLALANFLLMGDSEGYKYYNIRGI